MNEWSSWSNCPCGYTNPKQRTRTIKHPQVGNGRPCPQKQDSGTCALVNCDCSSKPGYKGPRCEDRDCVLGPWSSWSPTCPGCPRGETRYNAPALTHYKRRSKSIQVHRDGNGSHCTGRTSDSTSCGYVCKVDYIFNEMYSSCKYIRHG